MWGKNWALLCMRQLTYFSSTTLSGSSSYLCFIDEDIDLNEESN